MWDVPKGKMATETESLIASALQDFQMKMYEIRTNTQKEERYKLQAHVRQLEQEWFQEKSQLQAHISQLEQKLSEYEKLWQDVQTTLNQGYSKLKKEEKQLVSLKEKLDEREKELTRREQQLEEKLTKTKHATDDESLGNSQSENFDAMKQKPSEHNDSSNATHPDILSSTNSLVVSIPSSRRERSSSFNRSPRPRAKVYGVIRPGSVTHEDVQRQFSEYFTKYRRQYGSLLMENKFKLKTIPCHVLQVAFDICKNKVVCLVQKTMSNDGTCDDVRQARKLLRKGCVSTSSMEPEKRQLQSLFIPPIATRELKVTPDGWQENKYAFSLLLNSSAIESDDMIQQIKKEILREKITDAKNPEITSMLDIAVRLAWDMVTLVPPAIVYQPEEYREEWQEKRFTSWNEDPSYTHRPLQYYRPVLFFSTLGHVGCKGEVGNTSKGATVTPDQQGFHTPMSPSQSPNSKANPSSMHATQHRSAYFSPKVACLSKNLQQVVGIKQGQQ